MVRQLSMVVLAGGLNTRLPRKSVGQPKCLVDLDRYGPLLLRLLAKARTMRVPTIVVADDDVCQLIVKRAGWCLENTRFVVDDFGGAGAALARGVEESQTPWALVANADTLVPTDILAWGLTTQPGAPVHQLLFRESNQNRGLLGLDPSSGMLAFHGEATQLRPPTRLQEASTSGVVLVRRDAIQRVGALGPKVSFDRDLVPELISEGGVSADLVTSHLPIFDFGTLSRLKAIRADHKLREAIFAAADLGPMGTTTLVRCA
jgi:molybdopterin-guanine dinucleotide biosynthesis protein A